MVFLILSRTLFIGISILLFIWEIFFIILVLLFRFWLFGYSIVVFYNSISEIHNFPAKFFKCNISEQIILTVPEIQYHLTFQGVSSIETKGRPPRLGHLLRGLFFFFVLFLFSIVFSNFWCKWWRSSFFRWWYFWFRCFYDLCLSNVISSILVRLFPFGTTWCCSCYSR